MSFFVQLSLGIIFTAFVIGGFALTVYLKKVHRLKKNRFY